MNRTTLKTLYPVLELVQALRQFIYATTPVFEGVPPQYLPALLDQILAQVLGDAGGRLFDTASQTTRSRHNSDRRHVTYQSRQIVFGIPPQAASKLGDDLRQPGIAFNVKQICNFVGISAPQDVGKFCKAATGQGECDVGHNRLIRYLDHTV